MDNWFPHLSYREEESNPSKYIRFRGVSKRETPFLSNTFQDYCKVIVGITVKPAEVSFGNPLSFCCQAKQAFVFQITWYNAPPYVRMIW